MNYIDAHCHLANLAEVVSLPSLLDEAEAAGIGFFASSALRKCEVAWHLANPDPRIVFSAGIHPNFDECDLDMKYLRKLCEDTSLWAIGEIGLDNNNPEIAVQREDFTKQLELAADFHLPVVLHLVGHQEEAFSTLKQYPLKYLIHGYAGSVQGFNQLKRLDAIFTISNRIVKEDKLDLLNAMLTHQRILFETDITQYYLKDGEQNPLLRLPALVQKCSELSQIPVPNLLSLQARSAKYLFGR